MRHRCVNCGKLFDEKDIVFAPDPFEEEINENDTPVWECEKCREESAGDI